MRYLKSILAGVVLLIGCVALLTFALFAIGRDLRGIMGHFPLISLPTMLAVFAVGALYQFRRESRRGRKPEENRL